MSMLSVADVSLRLQVTPGRVRQLIETGALRAQKVGSQWIIQDIDLVTLGKRSNGRPWSPSAAWGVIGRALDRPTPWLSARERSRADERLVKGIDSIVDKLSFRAQRFEYRAHPSALARLQNDPRWVAGGVSAAVFVGADLVVGDDIIEGYMRTDDLNEVRIEFGLIEPGRSSANVILHSYSGVEPFELAERSVPLLVVALDLLEHSDERSKRAARGLLRTFEANRA
jgi:hypothetical protein